MLFLPNKLTMTDAIIEESEIFLNIPIVSDVIAVGRVGMLYDVVDVEKADYDGESRRLFVFEKIEGYEEFEPTFCYATALLRVRYRGSRNKADKEIRVKHSWKNEHSKQ